MVFSAITRRSSQSRYTERSTGSNTNIGKALSLLPDESLLTYLFRNQPCEKQHHTLDGRCMLMLMPTSTSKLPTIGNLALR